MGIPRKVQLGAFAAVVVAVAALVQSLMPYTHKPMLSGADLPHYVMCETNYGKPCNRTRPTRWLTDFYEPMARHAAQIVDSGRKPVVVHIGAADFRDDTPEYLPLLNAARGFGPLRLVLVEPETEKRETLLAVHEGLHMQAKDVTVVTAAMNKECTGNATQYIYSDQLFRDFAPPIAYEAIRSSLRSWRSFTKDNLLNALEAVGTKESFATGEGSDDRWDIFHSVVVPVVRKIHQAGNASEYIEETTIPCITAADLMVEADMKPSDIVMSTIDAEGFDIPILSVFLRLEGFAPILQRWEGSIHDYKVKDTIQWFANHSYRIGTGGYAHSQDVFAYRGDPV